MSGYVYFVRSGEDGPVKIGYAADVLERVHGLQAGNPELLTIVRIVSGSRNVEARLHRHFADIRIRGEWFKYSDEMLEIHPDELPVASQPAYASQRLARAGGQLDGQDALARAIECIGGQAALARCLGKKQAHVWGWLFRSGRVPATMAIPIEKATGGKITRHDLRPDIYPREDVA